MRIREYILRTIVCVLSFSASVHVIAQTAKPNLRNTLCDSVVIYDYGQRSEDGEQSIIVNGKLSVTVKKSARLDKTTASALSDKLEQKSSYGEPHTACFNPHLGVVYWHQGRPAAYVSICMRCKMLEASQEIEALLQGREVTEDGHVYYTLTSFSKPFTAYLNDLLKKYNFSHQREE